MFVNCSTTTHQQLLLYKLWIILSSTYHITDEGLNLGSSLPRDGAYHIVQQSFKQIPKTVLFPTPPHPSSQTPR